MKSSWADRFWVAVLVVGTAFVIGMLGWLAYPYVVEYIIPATPTAEPGRTVVREVPRPEEAGECYGDWVSVQDAGYPPYALSALSAAGTMGLLPEDTKTEDIEFAWSWDAERGLEYKMRVDGDGEFTFTVDCFVEMPSGMWIVFDTVEIRQLSNE